MLNCEKNILSTDYLVKLPDDEIKETIVQALWTDSFFFTPDTLFKWDISRIDRYLLWKKFTKILEWEFKNSNFQLDLKLENFINKLYISSKTKNVYSYVFNIYFPGEWVYSFYYDYSMKNFKDKIYYDIDLFIWDIKKFLSMRKNDEYFVSIFSSKPWWWNKFEWNFKIANNINYEPKRKVV